MKTKEAAYICPVTKQHVTFNKVMDSHGVCHSCGDIKTGTMTHAVKVSGYWVKPSFMEYICGKRAFFVNMSEISCE